MSSASLTFVLHSSFPDFMVRSLCTVVSVFLALATGHVTVDDASCADENTLLQGMHLHRTVGTEGRQATHSHTQEATAAADFQEQLIVSRRQQEENGEDAQLDAEDETEEEVEARLKEDDEAETHEEVEARLKEDDEAET